MPTTNHYDRILDLDTDSFWVLATMVLRGSDHRWEPSAVVSVLLTSGYYRENDEIFDQHFVRVTLSELAADGWVKSYARSFYEVPVLALRAVRQYLLANFPDEAGHLAGHLSGPSVSRQIPMSRRGRPRRARSMAYSNRGGKQEEWLSVYTGKKDILRLLLPKLTPFSDPVPGRKLADLQHLCGVNGEPKDLEAAALLLPPYPPDFLNTIPAPARDSIARSFALHPQLFLTSAHPELWRLLEELPRKDEQLVVRATVNFLPELPPGAGPDLWERYPDLAAATALVSGRELPEAVVSAFQTDPLVPNAAWLLRACAELGAKRVTPHQLKGAFARLRYLSPGALDLILAPTDEPGPVVAKQYGFVLFDFVLGGLALLWSGNKVPLPDHEAINIELLEPQMDAFPWLKGQLISVALELGWTEYMTPELRDEAAEITHRHHLRYLNDLISPPSEWETFLLAVEGGAAAGAKNVEQAKEGATRMAYIYEPGREVLVVREQSFGKKGWTSGRKIEWSAFSDRIATPADEALLPALRDYRGNPVNYRRNDYWNSYPSIVDVNHALYLLAGHPHVFEGDRARLPLEIEAAEAQILVDHDEEGNLNVRVEPPNLPAGYTARRASPGKYLVYHVKEEMLAITKLIPNAGMTLPAAAAERFERVLPNLRRNVPVLSSTDWKDQNLPIIEGQAFPCFHLVPLGANEHRLEIYIKPVPDGSFYFRPEEGLSRSLVATEETGRSVLARDLAAEVKAVEECLSKGPALADLEPFGYDILLTDDRQTLEVLTELNVLVRDGLAVLEYPKGQRLRLGGTLDDEQLQVQVSSGRDWFRVDVGLQLDEERVIDFELILESLRNKDKYVKIGEDEFLTLTDGLRDRLQKMDGLLHKNRDNLELAPLAGAAFAEAMEGLKHVQTDIAWTENLDRMANAARFVPPPPPPEFCADLRDYQTVGYEWLLRLANWGVGACLADDMGLGKTIQALAVLTARGDDGPALVIAPASVIRNWRTEAERFAPTLTPRLIGSSAEAESVLSIAGPNDIVLLSFGLLTYISEALLATEFHTLVVDEAQAIKNPATQRSRLVRDINARWKVATTGTPIENNLSELWSLFRFLNPGLFGSYKRFRTQYETPITVHENDERAEQLRRLVRPFILRRRKEEVLKELPPKTEIVRTVDPGPEEKSLYEALRRKALRDIDSADQMRKRFIVLQQLTQLRQAACNPKLLNKRSKVPSAKLQAVGETIREILDGGHKALIFSQFVGHLKLVEQWVKQEGFAYQYLDGSTPGKTRQKRVEAFQDGTGDLFLISLKAGGTGLNLTEADFVLHLDPWWNPAVEDQASDRAHRMGQLKHVTVYRFVTAGTIEEQILELHAAKRDLADRLLEGTDSAGKLSVDDVVELLREG